MTMLNGQDSTVEGGDRIRGSYVTQMSLEGVRSIRYTSFSSLSSGTKGLIVTGGQWVFSGTETTVTGGYITTVGISSLASDWVKVTGRTKWKHGVGRSGTVVLDTELTNWRAAGSIGDWSSISLQGSYVPGGSPLFNDITVAGNYAYVTSEKLGGAAGLYIIDLASLASPQRVASTLDLGAAGYDAVAHGTGLYVITDDPPAELKVYNITSPTSLSSSTTPIATYNVPGSGRGRALAISGTGLLLGATASATSGEHELYAFDIGTPSAISLLRSLDSDSSSIRGIAISGSSAYLASSQDDEELKVVALGRWSNMSILGGSQVTGSEDGYSIAVSGTSALLGRQKGSIQEMVLFHRGGSGLLPSSPGPWYHEGSGSLVAVDIDPRRCVLFLAAASSNKGFQVVQRNINTLPELATYTSTNGAVRGMYYDPVRDRVYLATENAFLVIQPGSSTGTCP
jgi:hypothetical protein